MRRTGFYAAYAVRWQDSDEKKFTFAAVTPPMRKMGMDTDFLTVIQHSMLMHRMFFSIFFK